MSWMPLRAVKQILVGCIRFASGFCFSDLFSCLLLIYLPSKFNITNLLTAVKILQRQFTLALQF